MMMNSLLLSAFACALLLALTLPLDRLAGWLAARLNADWKDSATAFAEAADLPDPVQAELASAAVPQVPRPAPPVVWAFGLAVALLTGARGLVFPQTGPVDMGLSVLLGAGVLVALLVDIRIHLLPDALVWPLAGLAAVASLTGHGPAPDMALTGALAGGGALWLLSAAFLAMRGVAGLGLGDVKLVAMSGLWLGAFALPWMLMLATLGGGIAHLAMHRGRPDARMAFGPALALSLLTIRLVPMPF